MKLIKNGVVSMEWEAERFIESKKDGFIAAIRSYKTETDTLHVIFMQKRAFLLLDAETAECVSIQDILGAIKEVYKAGEDMADYYEDNYVEIGTLVEMDEEVCAEKGLSDEDVKDILERLNDLSGYWYAYEEVAGEQE